MMIRKRHVLAVVQENVNENEHFFDPKNVLSRKTSTKRRNRKRKGNHNIEFFALAALFLFVGVIICWWPAISSNSILRGRQSETLVEDDYDLCGCHPHDGTGARIAFLINLHNLRTLNDCLDLVKSIATPSNIILIHIDRKLSMKQYETSSLKEFIKGECEACGAKVLVKSKFDLEWGKWSMNLPTIWSMTELITNKRFDGFWDVYMNLSADTLAVYTPQILSDYFDPKSDPNNRRGLLHSINFVTSSSCATGLVPTSVDSFPSSWHKRKHYEAHGDFDTVYVDEFGEEKNGKLTIHFGSQWMILTTDFVRYIALSLQREDSLATVFKKELIYRKVLMTDETFIPTILANHPDFSQTLPKLRRDKSLALGQHSELHVTSIRYERMDENMPDAFLNVVHDQRYDVPDSLIEVLDVPRKWGPYYLGVYDLGNIKESGALFIRKVSKLADPNLFHLFPVSHSEQIPDIRWPTEVKISDKIDWMPILEMLKRMKVK